MFEKAISKLAVSEYFNSIKNRIEINIMNKKNIYIIAILLINSYTLVAQLHLQRECNVFQVKIFRSFSCGCMHAENLR